MTCHNLLQWGLNNMRVQGWFSQVVVVFGGGALFLLFPCLLCFIFVILEYGGYGRAVY